MNGKRGGAASILAAPPPEWYGDKQNDYQGEFRARYYF